MRRDAHSPVRDRGERRGLLHRGNRVRLTEHRHIAVTALPLIRTAQQTGGLAGQLDARLLAEPESAHHRVTPVVAHRLADQDSTRVR